jgi:hypothetical protein
VRREQDARARQFEEGAQRLAVSRCAKFPPDAQDWCRAMAVRCMGQSPVADVSAEEALCAKREIERWQQAQTPGRSGPGQRRPGCGHPDCASVPDAAPDRAEWCRAVVTYCASRPAEEQPLCFQHEVQRRQESLAARDAADAATLGSMLQFQQQWNNSINRAFPRPRTCFRNLSIETCY